MLKKLHAAVANAYGELNQQCHASTLQSWFLAPLLRTDVERQCHKPQEQVASARQVELSSAAVSSSNPQTKLCHIVCSADSPLKR